MRTHGEVKVRERPINSSFENLKEEKIMGQRACKIRIKREEFKGMPESEKITVNFKDDKLILSGISRGWKFEKDIEPIEFDGENVQVEVNSSMLGKVISQQKADVNMFLVGDERKAIVVNHTDRYYYVN